MKHVGIITLVLLGHSSSVALKAILRKRLSDRSESLFPHFICELLKFCIELFCKPIELVKHYLKYISEKHLLRNQTTFGQITFVFHISFVVAGKSIHV